jgi:hypothetical protein
MQSFHYKGGNNRPFKLISTHSTVLKDDGGTLLKMLVEEY